jgi:antitoxin component YwqK of YwqJK toxin-antitoxin module
MAKRKQSTAELPQAKHLRYAVASVFDTPELVERILLATCDAQDFRAFALSFSLAGRFASKLQAAAKDKFATRTLERIETGVRITGTCLPNKALHGDAKVYDVEYGTLLSSGQYKNNKREGMWRSYYESLQVHTEVTYVNGAMHGTETSYWPDGSLRGVCHHVNGVVHGPLVIYYDNGAVSRKVTFFNGRAIGMDRKWMMDGTLECEMLHGNEPGTWKQWNYNGYTFTVANYKNHKLNGRYEERFQQTNEPHHIQTLKNGVMHGPWYFFDHGRLETADQYRNGKLHGIQKEWRDGKLHSVKMYRKNEQHGPQRRFWPNGRVRHAYCCFGGFINGIERYYTPSGRVSKTARWCIGSRVDE